jgi:cell division protein FtsN
MSNHFLNQSDAARRRARFPSFALAALLLSPLAALADPLSKEACDAHRSEQETLAAAGVKADMDKGAVWAKANLPRDRLNQIRRYIEIEEQLLFRCGLAKVKFTTLPEEEATTPPPAQEPKVKPKARPKPKAKEQAEPQPASEPARDAAAASASQAPSAVPAAKPKPKPRVDDAYRPPAAANPGTDPFARQLQAPKQ